MNEFDYLRDMLAKGRLSRRDFLGRASAIGFGAAAAAALPQFAMAAGAPQKGGTLKLGLGGGSTTDSMDIGSYNDSVMVAVSRGIFNGLVEWGQDGRPTPELAEKWEPRANATEWVLTLRTGVTFHNGKEFDADDAIYSLNLHRGETKSGFAAPMKAVKDIKKLDKNKISIELAAADADFPYVLTDYHALMVPNGFKDWAKPIGTGAFTLERFDPGVRMSGKKFANFWKQGRGHLDGFEITVIGDAAARTNALLTGQVDAINRVDIKTIAIIQRDKNLEIIRAAGGWHPVMAAQTDVAPYNNLDFRIALKHALDREQIRKTLFNDYGVVGNDHPIPKGDPYFHAQLPQLKYDPEKAKFHFKKAGLTDPKAIIQASDAAFNGAVDMATLFQASAAKCGIKLDVKKEPSDGFWDNIWLKGQFVTSYWAGRAAATQMLDVAYKAGAAWNETHWNNAKFEKLLADARGETDEAKRKTYIWDMQELLSKEGGAFIPAFRDWVTANSKKVGGITPHSGFDMNNGMVLEKAWKQA